jgi:hypothetical protein
MVTTTQPLTTADIFRKLEGRAFRDYNELLEAVRKIWQENIGILPVEIGPKDITDGAIQRGWIIQNAYTVKVTD